MTHQTASKSGFRPAAAAILIVGGFAVAAATWTAGDHGWAIGSMAAYVVLAAAAYVWAGRSGDFAMLLRGAGDERQRGLDREATAITAVVMVVVAIVGAVVDIGRTGNPGEFGVLCMVAGISYCLSLFGLRRRS